MIFPPKDARDVKRTYIAVYLIALCTLITSSLMSYNAFTEVGSVIVIYALYRGAMPLSKALGSAENLKDWRLAAQSGKSVSLRQDIHAGVVGTFLGGFSGPLYVGLNGVFAAV